MPKKEDILKGALKLDIQDRAALAERLLESLDDLSEAENERLWAEEFQRRLQDCRAGRASEVHAKVERLLR